MENTVINEYVSTDKPPTNQIKMENSQAVYAVNSNSQPLGLDLPTSDTLHIRHLPYNSEQ